MIPAPRQRRGGGARVGWVVHALAITVVGFLALPLIVVVGASVSATEFVTFPPEGFSIAAYQDAIENEAFVESFWLSAKVAAIVALVATSLGVLASVSKRDASARERGILASAYLAPLGMPQVVLGVALLQVLGLAGLGLSILTLAAGHLIIAFPFATRLTDAALAETDPNLERAAATLGAGRLHTFRRVTLPSLRAAIAASLFIAANVSFDNVGISLFLSSADVVTLPVRMLYFLEERFAPFLAAIGSVLILLPLLLAFIADRLYGLPRLFGLGLANRSQTRSPRRRLLRRGHRSPPR